MLVEVLAGATAACAREWRGGIDLIIVLAIRRTVISRSAPWARSPDLGKPVLDDRRLSAFGDQLLDSLKIAGRPHRWLQALPADLFRPDTFRRGRHADAESSATMKQQLPAARIVNWEPRIAKRG